MGRKKAKAPDLYRRLIKTTRFGSPPLHERTFPRSLPRKRGRCREAIGMGLAHHCVYLSFHSHMILEIRQYPKVTVTAVAYVPFILSVLRPGTNQPDRAETKLWKAGRESNPDLQLRTLPCCSVTLPTLWNSRRESNPDLFVRTEASSCLRPREPSQCGGDAEN
jgi:hypothetical protein